MGVLNDYTNAAAVNAALNKGVEANKAVSELKEDLVKVISENYTAVKVSSSKKNGVILSSDPNDLTIINSSIHGVLCFEMECGETYRIYAQNNKMLVFGANNVELDKSLLYKKVSSNNEFLEYTNHAGYKYGYVSPYGLPDYPNTTFSVYKMLPNIANVYERAELIYENAIPYKKVDTVHAPNVYINYKGVLIHEDGYYSKFIKITSGKLYRIKCNNNNILRIAFQKEYGGWNSQTYGMYDVNYNIHSEIFKAEEDCVCIAYYMNPTSPDATIEFDELIYEYSNNSTEKMFLIWEDDFDGDSIDENRWNYMFGADRASTGRIQFYKKQNITTDNSCAVITAKREETYGYPWTSGCLTTCRNKYFQYGKIEAKIKMPSVEGSFPAFWMLGNPLQIKTFDDGQERVILRGSWEEAGEIDIVEQFGTSAIASGEWKPDWTKNSNYTKSIDTTKFHVYGLEWTQTTLKYLVDGTVIGTTDITKMDLDNYHHHPFYILLCLQVGGSGGTPPDDLNEMKMYIDWVRVWG